MIRIWNNVYLLMAFNVIIWGSSVAAVAYLMQSGMKPAEALVGEILFALAALAAGMLLRPASRQALWRDYRWQHLPSIVLCGVTGVYLICFCLYYAISSSPGDAAPYAVINYLWPLLTMVFGVLILKERPTRILYIGLACGFLGFLVIQAAKFAEAQQVAAGAASLVGGATPQACWLTFCGATSWAFFSVASRKFSDRYHFEPVSSVVLFTVVGAAVALAIHGWDIRWGFMLGDWRFVALLVLLGAGANGITTITWLRAIKLAGSGRSALVAYLTPVLALGYLGVFMNQWPRWYSLIGLAMILGAILLVETRGRKSRE